MGTFLASDALLRYLLSRRLSGPRIIQSDRLAGRQWPRKRDEIAPAEVCLPNYIWLKLTVKGIRLPYCSPGRRKRTLCRLEGNDPIWTTCEEQIIKTSLEHNNPLSRNPCNSPVNGQKAKILGLVFGKPWPLISLGKGDIWEYFRPVQPSGWHMAESPKI